LAIVARMSAAYPSIHVSRVLAHISVYIMSQECASCVCPALQLHLIVLRRPNRDSSAPNNPVDAAGIIGWETGFNPARSILFSPGIFGVTFGRVSSVVCLVGPLQTRWGGGL